MTRVKPVVALIFPPVPAMSRLMTEGIMEKHLDQRGWCIIELPRTAIGQSPLPEGGLELDGAIIWAEPRDRWVHELIAQGVRVVNCGTEWLGVKGVASVHFRFGDLHQAVISHFAELRLRHVAVIGHQFLERPATQRIMQQFALAAQAANMPTQLWNLDGEDSPSSSPHRLLKPEREVALAAFLKALPKPAGIYCAGDHIAFIVCAVAARAGLRVPGDLAVIGQGDNRVACFAQPPLSSVTGPAREVGYQAATCLAQWLTTGTAPFSELEIAGATLIKRESTVGSSGSVALEAVRRFISLNAARGISLGDLASLSGVGVKTLTRRYREAFGCDPLQEIHALRLTQVKRLLASPSLPLSDVADACGFSSQAGLYNYFKRHAGINPSEFRASAGPAPTN